jgi:hypothetical protein
MARKRSQPRAADRSGVILLVVISLLVLFSLVGLAFVVYAESQANTARIWREGSQIERPDMDPELLLSYFLGQLIYGGTGNSPLQGPNMCLADNMYGRPVPGAMLTVPYDATRGAVPYTYPDAKNAYLAAVKAGPIEFFNPGTGQLVRFGGTDGAVLTPSFVRQGMPLLRPAGLPPPADAGGDVKNLTSSPGTYIAGTQPPQFANNDSIWIDLGFPTVIAANGTRFKPLFAPLITDFDNRLNVNIHGNILSTPDGGGFGAQMDPWRGRSVSHMGWGPWEVSLERVLQAPDDNDPNTGQPMSEARRIFIGGLNQWYGGQSIKGRYDLFNPNAKDANGNPIHNFQWGDPLNQLAEDYTVKGPSYNPTDYDGTFTQQLAVQFPGFSNPNINDPKTGAPPFTIPAFSPFPYYSFDFQGGDTYWECANHPLGYNFFNPSKSSYGTTARGRNFEDWNMEALLRYGDTGSPALPSRLFRCCPKSLADPRVRRLLTTVAFDIDRPALTEQMLQQPPPPTGPGLHRVNLNRDFPRGSMGNKAQDSRSGAAAYPDLMTYQVIDPIGNNPLTLNTGQINAFNDAQQFIWATKARQDFAQEIFTYLRQLNGLPDPNNPPLKAGDPLLGGLRKLAQIAVNIVDYIDMDDNMTPFPWYKGDQVNPQTWDYVFGNELPRLVLNEVFTDIANDPTDPVLTNKTGGATKPYRVRFWIELNNPLQNNSPGYTQGNQNFQGNPMPKSDGGKARLRVLANPQANPFPTNPNNRPFSQSDPNTFYSPYQIVITTNDTAKLTDPANTKGDSTQTPNIKTQVTDFVWQPPDPMTNLPLEPNLVNWGKKYPPWQDEINVVQPMDKYPRGVNEDNYGYYVVGPKDDFPGTDPKNPNPTIVRATMRVKETIDPNPLNNRGLVYTVPTTTDPGTIGGPMGVKHTIVLRRLACPNMPPDNNPGSPTYNPYVTVDYMEDVLTNDCVKYDSKGVRTSPPAPAPPLPPTVNDITQAYSMGRSQPYAADKSQQVPQKPANPTTGGQPQHTFFNVNVQVVDPKDPVTGATPGKESTNPPNTPPPNGQLQGFPNDWLTFADRPLVSPIELMMVSKYPPHLLTQYFVRANPPAQPNDPVTGEPPLKHQHVADWLDPTQKLWPLFEFVSASAPVQWAPVGGRVLGRININTVWDPEIFRALTDPQQSNIFWDPQLQTVDRIFYKMVSQRSPGLAPGAGDRPFKGMGAGNTIDETILMADPLDPTLLPQQKRRLFEPEGIDPNNGLNRSHPTVHQELLRKIFNNVTTRSNVFGVWLTVGFFEVVNDTVQPAQLGAEVGRAEGRHIRHRMFAILDRTAMTIATQVNPGTLQVMPKQDAMGNIMPGSRPFYIPTHAPVVYLGAQTLKVAGTSDSAYDGSSWNLAGGDFLLIDPGPNQEVVQATGISPTTIQAAFNKTHPARCSILRVQAGAKPGSMPGHPGPQPRFDMRNPMYQGVVRYFSIIK